MTHFRSASRIAFAICFAAITVELDFADVAAAPPPTASVGQIARLDIVDRDGRPSAVTAMAVSQASGLIMIGSADNDLQLIDARTMTVLDRTRAHRDRIQSLSFSPQGSEVVSVGNDGRLQVWSLDRRASKVAQPMAIHSVPIRIRRSQVIDRTPALTRVAFSPGGGNITAVGFTKKIFVLGREGNPSGRIACSHTDLRALTFDGLGRLIVAGKGGAVHVFGHDEMTPVATTGLAARSSLHDHDHEICRCQTNPGSINDIALLPSDGRIVCVCDRGIISQYDPSGNEVDGRIGIAKGRLFAVEPIDSHTVAVAGSDDSIRMVDLSLGRVTKTFNGHRGSIVDLAMIDSRLISAGFDATVRVWRTPASATPNDRHSRVAERTSTDAAASPTGTGL